MALTFFNTAVAAGSGNGVPTGLFIPALDFPGIVAGEFGSSASQATKEGKFVLAWSNALRTFIESRSTLLGIAFSMAKASVNANIDALTFTAQHQYVAKLESGYVGKIPVPTSGTNSGVGGFAIAEIFPNAAYVLEDSAISAEGVLIPAADILPFMGEGLSTSDVFVGNDNRDFVAAINRAMPDLVSIRSASVASGLTAATQTQAATFTLPAAATNLENPTSGILATDLDKIATFQLTTSWTVQILLDQENQTFDVNVVTA